MNQQVNRLRSFQIGCWIILICEMLATALFWAVHQSNRANSEYWLYDLMLFLPTAGSVVLLLTSMVLLTFLKIRSDEISKIPLVAVVLMALPLPLALAGTFTSSAWYMAILPYLVFAGAALGISITLVRMGLNRP
ncbi:MAG: hypothetical protein WCG75_09580 [Armatimonadota bacterium]